MWTEFIHYKENLKVMDSSEMLSNKNILIYKHIQKDIIWHSWICSGEKKTLQDTKSEVFQLVESLHNKT